MMSLPELWFVGLATAVVFAGVLNRRRLREQRERTQR